MLMESSVSSSFVYAILGGFFAVLALIYYQKSKDPEFKRHPVYYAGVFFIISNIIYHLHSPSSGSSQIKMKNVFNPSVCEMKTGQPSF